MLRVMPLVFYSESLTERSGPFDKTRSTGNGPIAVTCSAQQVTVRMILDISQILFDPAIPMFEWLLILKEIIMEFTGIIYLFFLMMYNEN